MLTVEAAEFAKARVTAGWSASMLALVIGSITAILLIPAAYNGFPLVFPDTSAYFAVAYADRWPIDRAGFYGLWLSPALITRDAALGVWLAAAMQSAVVSAALIAVIRRVAPQLPPGRTVALVAAVAALTSLPWHTSQMIPDAVTGSLVLLVWLAASRDLRKFGTPLLWLGTAALTLVHFTHIIVVAGASAAAITASALAGTSFSELAKRAIAALLTLASVVAAHTAVYGLYFDRWEPSPLGGYFLFARLNEDGLVPQWMDRHCGRGAPEPLCEMRSSLPRDSQVLLWGGPHQSPLYGRINQRTDEPEVWHWVDMVSTVAFESLKDAPATFATQAATATARQFVHYQALDDLCPETCRNLRMFEWRPSLIQPVLQSRQLTGRFAEERIRAVTSSSATMGLVLLLPFMILAYRRRDMTALSLLLTITAALVANAATTGALSDVHDRYQSRVVWLAPFAVVLLTARWRSRKSRA